MRLYYAHVGSPFVDIEWDPDTVTKYKKRIANIYNLIFELIDKKEQENIHLDNWLKSILNRRIKKIVDAFENFDLRVASNEIFFECPRDINWYLKRGGSNKILINKFVKNWILLLSPVTPHLGEELWHILGNDFFVSNESYPKFNSKEINEPEEVGEYLLSEIINDINEILKVTKISPKKICIYISPLWKRNILRKAIELNNENKLNVGFLMKQSMSDSNLKTIAKNVSQFVGKLPNEIKKLSENDRNRYLVDVDEKDYLKNAKKYLIDMFSCDIEIFSSDEKDIYDPMNKSKFALPLRPAIYIE
jgi:leucyl-tRNA synthetase